MKKKILRIIEILLVIFIIVQIFLIFEKEYAGYKRDKNKEKIEEIIKADSLEENNKDIKQNAPAEEAENKKEIKRDYMSELKKLQDYNKNVVGLIVIPGTKVNYPVLQAKDNEYYLDHDIDNNYNVFGEVFMDYRNSKKIDDDNIIIYGHNIRKKKDIFNELLNYQKKDFFEKNNEILYITDAGIKKYRIFTSYVTDPYDKYRIINFDDNEAKNTYFSKMKDRTFIKNNISNNNSQLITLSTCETHDSRMVVQGILEDE